MHTDPIAKQQNSLRRLIKYWSMAGAVYLLFFSSILIWAVATGYKINATHPLAIAAITIVLIWGVGGMWRMSVLGDNI